MRPDPTMKRFDRIVALLIQLQSKKVVKAADLAERFGVSLRTIYRDIRTLEVAGVPIYGEAGTGYSLIDGYRLPPVMFTREEATSFITAERLMERFSDESFKKHFESAVYKIKSVLHSSEKEWMASLESRIGVSQREKPAHTLLPEMMRILFESIARKIQLQVAYKSFESDQPQSRYMEPVSVYHEYNHWYVNAWCHLRKEYRTFRTDRFLAATLTNKAFELEHENPDLLPAETDSQASGDEQTIRILVEPKAVRYVEYRKQFFGFVSEQVRDNGVEWTFRINLEKSWFIRWFITFADHADILEPEELKLEVRDLLEKMRLRVS